MSQSGGLTISGNTITANFGCSFAPKITFTRSGGNLILTNTGDAGTWVQGDISILNNMQ